MARSKKYKRKAPAVIEPVVETKQATITVAGSTGGYSKHPLFFPFIMTGVFLLIAAFGMTQHEMWRDEHQAWLVARDAHSLPGLFQNMKYEGNPALWQFFLFIITRFTHNPVFMQIFHLLIATGFIYVFNRYAPIRKPFKVLFTLGYFPLYEYAVISRSYSLGILLLFIVCALYKERSNRYLWIGLALGLLANVTIYSLIISVGFGGILLLDYIFYQPKNKKLLIQFAAGFIIFAILALFSLYQIWPEKDGTFNVVYAKTAFEGPRWGFAASRLFFTYLYIPQASDINFWNSNIYLTDYVTISPTFGQWLSDNPAYMWGWVYMPILLFLTSCLIFLRKPIVLLLYAGVTLLLLSLYYYTILVYSRYIGHLFLILIGCYWLAEYYPEHKY